MARNNSGRGKGWFGDSEEHAKAGRKGGQASARSRRGSGKDDMGRDSSSDMSNSSMDGDESSYDE